MIFVSKRTGKFAEIAIKYLLKEVWFLSENFKSLLCIQKLLTRRKESCSNLTLQDTPKQKGLQNNLIECTHDVLAWNEIVVGIMCKEHLEKRPRAVCWGFLKVVFFFSI